MNTYQLLAEFQPFAIGDKTGLPFSLCEAFKKLVMGGDDVRMKTIKKDYEEALFSIGYAIEHRVDYELHRIISVDDIYSIMSKYAEVFPSANISAHEAAKHILFFSRSGQIEHLKNSLHFAQKAVEICK